MRTIGTEIFWPWYTLIGAGVTLGTAWVVRRVTAPGRESDEPSSERTKHQ